MGACRFERVVGSSLTGVDRDHTLPVSRLPLLAAIGGSIVTRTSSRMAFQVEGRGLVTQDMIPYLAKAFTEIFGEDVLQGGERGKL